VKNSAVSIGACQVGGEEAPAPNGVAKAAMEMARKAKNGRATVGIVNRRLGIGLAIRYSTREFPRCGNWQHYGPGEYVTALEPMNGYAISIRLKQVSGDVLQVSDGSLYPALHKLEQEGWITAEWKPSENNRRAKFYSLTRLGRKELEKEAANWNRLSAAISRVVKLKEA